MSTLELFGHPDSGHAFKVRFFMDAAGLDYDYTEVDIWSPRESRPARFRQFAAFGEVPLLIDDGRAYTQSNAILVYLAQRLGGWGAEDRERFQRCLQWLMWEANKIGLCLPQLVGDARFPESKLNDGARNWLLARYRHDVGVLEDRFADGRAFITGDSPSIADFSLCGYLYLADEAGLEVPTQVAAWLQRLSALPGWRHPK